jgi:hypothetical protein
MCINFSVQPFKVQISSTDTALFNLCNLCKTTFALANEKDVHLAKQYYPVQMLQIKWHNRKPSNRVVQKYQIQLYNNIHVSIKKSENYKTFKREFKSLFDDPCILLNRWIFILLISQHTGGETVNIQKFTTLLLTLRFSTV